MMIRRCVLAVLCCLPGIASSQDSNECRVLVAKEWVSMGATSLGGCLKFADEAATPGERQFAKFGETFLKVQNAEHFQSADGGNTWDSVASSQPAAGFSSLNQLQPPENEMTQLAPESAAEPAKSRVAPVTVPHETVTTVPAVKKKRKRSYNPYAH